MTNTERTTMEVIDRGPWAAHASDGKGVFIESDDFTHDVRLYVNGDFRDQEQCLTYAEGLAGILNETTAQTEAAANDERIAALEAEVARLKKLAKEILGTMEEQKKRFGRHGLSACELDIAIEITRAALSETQR